MPKSDLGGFLVSQFHETRHLESGGNRVATCALLLITLFGVGPAWRQSQNAAPATLLRGTVRDSRGRLLAAAMVYLLGIDEAQSVIEQTDSEGNYCFSALHSGTYTLRAEIPGYVAAESGPFYFVPAEGKKIDLVLEPLKPSSANKVAPAVLQTETSAIGSPQFYDEPQFTVAGVTDAANPGGHGSSMARRATEDLTKATVLLNPENPNHSAALKSDAAKMRTNVLAQLAQPNLTAENQAALHHQLAEDDEQLDDPLDAVREYQRAAELAPSESNLFDWGAELLAHRAFEPATEVFAQGNHLFPQSVRMLSGLGVAWYARGSFDQAFDHLCQASDLNPNDPQPYLFLGKMQSVETLQPKSVIERMARFAHLQPDNALANYYYAISLWKQRDQAGNLADAEKLLNKSLRLDPKLGAAYLQIGIIYFDRADFPQAIAAFQKTIQVTPDLEEAHYRLSQTYERTGERLKAQQELDLYQQLSRKKQANIERQRSQIQEFVYTLKSDPAPPK